MPGHQREASPSLVYGAGLLIPLGGNPLERSNRSASANEAPVAQVDRVSDYGSEGCRFESCRAHKQRKRFCSNRIALLQRITVTSVCASKRLIERQ